MIHCVHAMTIRYNAMVITTALVVICTRHSMLVVGESLEYKYVAVCIYHRVHYDIAKLPRYMAYDNLIRSMWSVKIALHIFGS